MAYLPPKILEQKLLQFLNEDAMYGDITSELVPDTLVAAELTSKQKGIVCGVSFAKILLESLGVEVLISSEDGDTIEKGSTILRLRGSSRAILISERVVLNLLMRLSGIATQTQELVEKTKRVKKNIIIASTRKTTPGFRYFEKYAVKIGGGDPHRWNLSDTILIKENHLKLLDEDPIPQILNQSSKISSFTKKIDIEVETISELKNALKFSPEIIMLDNFSVEKIKEAIDLINGSSMNNRPLLEVSGGITIQNIDNFIIQGIDIISVGALTHSVSAIDFSLKIKKIISK